MVIQEGEFTDDYLQKNDWWRDLPEVIGLDSSQVRPVDYEGALLAAEDENDAEAAIEARKEMNMDENEFDDTASTPRPSTNEVTPSPRYSRQTTPFVEGSDRGGSESVQGLNGEEDSNRGDIDNDEGGASMQLEVGHVDQYMLQFWEREVVGVDLGFGGMSY
jgi:helicase SWR1